jgi:hypothetical protein
MMNRALWGFCLFVLLAATAHAQDTTKNYRAHERRGLESLRKRSEFADPYETIKPKAPQAQTATDTARRKVDAKYEMAPPITRLLQRHIDYNAALTEADGFRVQVYSGAQRETAAKIRYDAGELVRGEHTVYSFYDRPYFKVRVGDFLTKDDADRVCKELRQTYPGAFVVPDVVKVQK